jgi:hypothetical protein
VIKLHSRIYHRLYVRVPVRGDLGLHDSIKVMGRFEMSCDGADLVFVNTLHASPFIGGGPEATSRVIGMLLDAGCEPKGDGANFTVGIDVARSIFKTLSETFSTLTGNYDLDTFDGDMEAVVMDAMRRHVTTTHQIMFFKSFYGNTDDRQVTGRGWANYGEQVSASTLRRIMKQGWMTRADVEVVLLELLGIQELRFEP